MKFSIQQLHELSKIHKEWYPEFKKINYEFCEGYILVNRYDSEGRCSFKSFSEDDITHALEQNKQEIINFRLNGKE